MPAAPQSEPSTSSSSSSTPFLVSRAKAYVQSGPPPPSKAGATWVTDLSFNQLQTIIGASFHGDPERGINGEPIIDWLFNQCPNPKIKGEAVHAVMAFPLKDAVGHKYMDLSVQTNDGIIASTAVLVEYQAKTGLKAWGQQLKQKWTEFSMLISMAMNNSLPQLFTAPEWKNVARDVKLKSALLARHMPKWHQQHGPQGRHLYVNFVASNPDCQGQGYGSILMRKINDLADAQRTDVYLECGNLKNKTFYEKFGYEVVASPALEQTPEVTQLVYLMVRRPR